MKKLSESQRLCLVHAAIGELHYTKGEHYYSTDMRITPFKQQSRVGASVAKMGYFVLPKNIAGMGCSGYVTLSEAGLAKFEEVVTDAERQKIDEHKRMEARRQLEREAESRAHKWDEDHRLERNANYERSREALRSMNEASEKLLGLALRLGVGANNVEEILVEMRKYTLVYNEQHSIHEETRQWAEAYNDSREAARSRTT